MVASLFGVGNSVILPTSSGLAGQQFTPFTGQTLFTLDTFSYVQETKSLWVFVNGKKLELGTQYLETTPETFTLLTPVGPTDLVEVIGFPLASVTVLDNTIFHSFPFYMASGVMNNVPLNSSGKLPFYFANGLSSPIPVI